jgi:hypothetical protein
MTSGRRFLACFMQILSGKPYPEEHMRGKRINSPARRHINATQCTHVGSDTARFSS